MNAADEMVRHRDENLVVGFATLAQQKRPSALLSPSGSAPATSAAQGSANGTKIERIAEWLSTQQTDEVGASKFVGRALVGRETYASVDDNVR